MDKESMDPYLKAALNQIILSQRKTNDLLKQLLELLLRYSGDLQLDEETKREEQWMRN
jgi:hypothetical protein